MRYFRLFFVVSAVLLLGGCTASSAAEDSNRLTIITTVFAAYDFAREITGGSADIKMLVPPGAEMHSYEPTPQDILSIQACDVFVYIGGESDEWVSSLLSTITSDVQIVALMDVVSVVEEELVDGMDTRGVDAIEYDEHVWTSVTNAQTIVRKLLSVICEVDKTNASYFVANTEAYLGKLSALDVAFREVVDGAVRRTLVFGDRFPFRYLINDYSLEYYAAFPGCSTETEPSVSTLAFLIDKIKSEQIPVVFHAEMSNGRIAVTLSEETGADVRLLHACHNISRDDFVSGVSYIELMQRNVDALKEALW